MKYNNRNNQENEKNEKMKKMLKRGAGVSLCAVLAGGMVIGGMDGFSPFAGWNQTQVSAQTQEEPVLLQTKSGETDEDSNTEQTAARGGMDVTDIVEKAMPSVVSITTKSLQEVQNYFGMFQYGNGKNYAPQQEVEGSGSGIIIGKKDDELLIATNNHVIEDAETVSVSFIDGASCEASVKGFDEDRDLAVVSVKLEDIGDDTMDAISIATIGDSDELKVGEQVVAIGNALGYGQSVTTGIVSAKNRRMDEGTEITGGDDSDSDDGVNLIQTDAAINPGNSGGALLNMNGEVVGINSAKLASTAIEGMGYSIAISDVADVLEDLMNATPREKVEDGAHGILGITGTSVSDEAAELYGMPKGVYVKEVTEGGAAEKAGIKVNAIITQFDGKRVKTIDELVELLQYYKAGEEVEVIYKVVDGDGYIEKTATVTLDENPDAGKEAEEDASDQKDDGESDKSIVDEWEEEQNGEADIREFFEQFQ